MHSANWISGIRVEQVGPANTLSVLPIYIMFLVLCMCVMHIDADKQAHSIPPTKKAHISHVQSVAISAELFVI